MKVFFTWILAFSIVLLNIHLLQPLALRIGLVDVPGGRKQHNGYVPLVGGIAMFIAFCFSVLTLHISLAPYRSFIAGSALLVFVGILDDFHELTAKIRFIAQILAALVMAFWGENQLHTFGNILFFGDIYLSYLSLPITILAVVGIINALNMLDGIDGLAGSLALISYCFLALLAYGAGMYTDLKILGILIFALLGFLIFNFRLFKSKKMPVFMGDAGSMFIGFSLVWFLISLSQQRHPISVPVIMLWIMAIPIFDTIRVLIRRMQHKKSPFTSDRDHIHHILIEKGLSASTITLLLTGFALLFCVLAIYAKYMMFPESIIFLAFIGVFIFYYFFVEKILQ